MSEAAFACYLCGAAGEMNFNAVVGVDEETGRSYMLDVPLCLACWGSYPDDAAVIHAIALKSQERMREQ